MDVGLVVSLTLPFIALGLVFLALAAMVRSGALARNGALGIRTAATRASDRAWEAGHLAAYGALKVTGWLCLAVAGLAGVLAALVGGSNGQVALVAVVVAGYGALAASLLVLVRPADAAARRALRPE